MRSRILMDALGVANLDCRQDGAKLDPALGRATYLFNTTIARHRQRRRRSCSSAPIRAGKRRCSMRASASAGSDARATEDRAHRRRAPI